MADQPIPLLDADPLTREELSHWLKRRNEQFPGEPLNPREYLMVQKLQNRRKAYSET